ncbi:uncharacterized protein LOC144871055 isoform X1 [Branchiostoma floridae x Branchiostoma japonicum]
MSERTIAPSAISDVLISEQSEGQEENLEAQTRTRSRSRDVSGLPSLQTAWETSKGMSRRGKTLAAEPATREDGRDVPDISDEDRSAAPEKGSEKTPADPRDEEYEKEQGGAVGPSAGYFQGKRYSSIVTASTVAEFAESYRRGSSLASSTSYRSSISQGSTVSGFSTSRGSISSYESEGRAQRLSSILKKPNRSLAKEQALNEFSKTDEHLAYIRDEALKNQVELPIGLLITMKKEVLTVVQETAKEYQKTVGPNHRLTMDALKRVDELAEEIKRMGF